MRYALNNDKFFVQKSIIRPSGFCYEEMPKTAELEMKEKPVVNKVVADKAKAGKEE